MMNKAFWARAALVWVCASVACVFASATSMAFELKSADIKSGGTIGDEFIYSGMGCTGQNKSPELHWSGAPKATRSFAITVYDPTAPTGSGFWHWIVINIPAGTTELPQGWQSNGQNGVEITNDFGEAKYGGPCPPPGPRHTYVFTIHALKTPTIGLPPNATNAIARFMIEGATIGKASFRAYYGRK